MNHHLWIALTTRKAIKYPEREFSNWDPHPGNQMNRPIGPRLNPASTGHTVPPLRPPAASVEKKTTTRHYKNELSSSMWWVQHSLLGAGCSSWGNTRTENVLTRNFLIKPKSPHSGSASRKQKESKESNIVLIWNSQRTSVGIDKYKVCNFKRTCLNPGDTRQPSLRRAAGRRRPSCLNTTAGADSSLFHSESHRANKAAQCVNTVSVCVL